MVAATAPRPVWRANRGGQWLAICSPHWEMLIDGNRGSGKSAALIASFLHHVGKGFGADWRGVIFRLTYPELGDLIDKSIAFISKAFPRASYNVAGHEWTFPGGEKLLFRHLENLRSYQHYHGQSFSFIGFDELTGWMTDEAYTAMLSCSRPPSARTGVPLKVRSTTNSWGSGFSWVKARFVTNREPFKPYGEEGRQRIRIPIQWDENEPFREADPAYHARLSDSISSEAQRAAWLSNSWDYVGGGRFADCFRESVHVLEPFNIPSSWTVTRSFDWGSSVPFATLWYAESTGEQIEDGRSWPRGTLFVIDEDYGCEGNPNDANWKPNVGLRLGPIEMAQRTRMHEDRMRQWGLIKRQPQPGPADDPLFDVSRGRSMASIMSEHGVVWNRPSKGPGSRITGWQLLEDRLKASMQHPMEQPGIFMFNTCQHLIRTLPLAMRDPKKPEDILLDEDHALDSARLKLLSYGTGNVVRGVSL